MEKEIKDLLSVYEMQDEVEEDKDVQYAYFGRKNKRNPAEVGLSLCCCCCVECCNDK